LNLSIWIPWELLHPPPTLSSPPLCNFFRARRDCKIAAKNVISLISDGDNGLHAMRPCSNVYQIPLLMKKSRRNSRMSGRTCLFERLLPLPNYVPLDAIWVPSHDCYLYISFLFTRALKHFQRGNKKRLDELCSTDRNGKPSSDRPIMIGFYNGSLSTSTLLHPGLGKSILSLLFLPTNFHSRGDLWRGIRPCGWGLSINTTTLYPYKCEPPPPTADHFETLTITAKS